MVNKLYSYLQTLERYILIVLPDFCQQVIIHPYLFNSSIPNKFGHWRHSTFDTFNISVGPESIN